MSITSGEAPFELTVPARSISTKQYQLTPEHASISWTDGTNTILYEASKVERDSGWTNVKGFQSITLNFDNTASLLRRKQVQIAVDLKNDSISPWLVSVPPRAYREAHRRAILGVRLFFANQFDISEMVFKSGCETQPILALGYSALAVVRAVTGLDPNGIQEAHRRVKNSLELCNSVIAKSSKGSEELAHTTLVKAECELMLGLTHLLSERIVSVLKCGLAVRRGFKLYKKAAKLMGNMAEPKSRGGVRYKADETYRISMKSLGPERRQSQLKAAFKLDDLDMGSEEEEQDHSKRDSVTEDDPATSASEEEALPEGSESKHDEAEAVVDGKEAPEKGSSGGGGGGGGGSGNGEQKSPLDGTTAPQPAATTSFSGVLEASLNDAGNLPGIRPCLPPHDAQQVSIPAVFGASDPLLTALGDASSLSPDDHAWMERLGPGGGTGSEDILLEGRGKMRRGIEGSLFFGFGSFNTLVSCLPSIALKLVEFLGFPSDRGYGEQLLEMSLGAGGIRAPVAGMILCGVRALLPTFYSPLDEEGTVTAAEKTLTFCLNSYPDSALFKWVEGRWKRRMRDPLAAANSLMSVATTSSELVQLQHVAAYELALTAFYSGAFAPAGLLLRFLFTHCPWSRRFFSYMAAICFLMEGEIERARLALIACLQSFPRKIAGREISADQHAQEQSRAILSFLARHQVLDDSHNPVMTPSIRRLAWLEMLSMFYLYNGADNAPTSVLIKRIKEIQSYLEGHAPAAEPQETWNVCLSSTPEEAKEDEVISWTHVSVQSITCDFVVKAAGERLKTCLQEANAEPSAVVSEEKVTMSSPPVAGFDTPIRHARSGSSRSFTAATADIPDSPEYWKKVFSFPAARKTTIHLDHLALVALVAGACLARLKYREAAEECFNYVLGHEKDIIQKWKIPYSMYELAVIAPTPALRMSWAKKAKKFKETFNYSWRLQFRVHLILTELRLLKKQL